MKNEFLKPHSMLIAANMVLSEIVTKAEPDSESTDAALSAIALVDAATDVLRGQRLYLAHIYEGEEMVDALAICATDYEAAAAKAAKCSKALRQEPYEPIDGDFGEGFKYTEGLTIKVYNLEIIE